VGLDLDRTTHPKNVEGDAMRQALILATMGALIWVADARAEEMPVPEASVTAIVDPVFQAFALDAHLPGAVWAVVQDGRLTHVGGFGVQDLESHRPVSADTLFRIASMTKAFTALTVLKLRDEGRVQLEVPAEQYVPQLRTWQYPTTDSPRIRVRDLLNHSAGFVTDDPWGDRQTPLPEAEFTRLLQVGVPFTRAPETAYEYSNLGFALLGRIISNVSGHPYAETIGHVLLQPLGMDSSGFVAAAAPAERRALGYRWEDNQWRPEPLLGPGAFGAMGGLQTSANDYAKWIAFLLSAWPPRDAQDSPIVKRSTVRELAQGSNFPTLRPRPGRAAPNSCQQAATYGMGMRVAADCELGLTLNHGGGYPGYGSYVLLLPERGWALFAFANRTYAAMATPVWDAALALQRAALLPAVRALPASAALEQAYQATARIYKAGDVLVVRDELAMNFLLDHSASHWSAELAALKEEVGDCVTDTPPRATGALTGEFLWSCTHGRVRGALELAPTRPPRIQQLQLEAVAP
jgi:CubicO group peptidase (beta-lactamase class C family)